MKGQQAHKALRGGWGAGFGRDAGQRGAEVRRVDPGFLLFVAMGFLAGGACVALGSALAERAGPAVGGLILGVPATAAVSLLFLALGGGVEAAVRATDAAPAGLGLFCLFAGFYGRAASRGPAAAMVAGLGAWVTGAAVLAVLPAPGFSVGLVIQAASFLLAWWLAGSPPRLPAAVVFVFTWPRIVLRAVVGGTVVAACLVLSHGSGALLGGLAAVFPAVTASSLGIVAASAGTDTARAMLRPTLVSASVVILGYTVAVRIGYPVLGVAGGTVAALVLAALLVVTVHRITRRIVHGQPLAEPAPD